MTAVSPLALSLPLIASNAIFCARRANRSAESIDENPVYSVANVDIALAQLIKGARAAKFLSIASAETSAVTAAKMEAWAEAVNKISNLNKFTKGVAKAVTFTADHINPVICVVGGLNALTQEDKVDALARESLALTTMFAAEGAAKEVIDMPKFSGKDKIVASAGVHNKNPKISQWFKKLDDYCQKPIMNGKVSLRSVPGILKGLIFAGASIGGYKAGVGIGNALLGEKPAENED